MTNRREFIIKSAIAAAGSSMAFKASSYNQIIGANDRINVCFMGLGRRVGGYYPALDKPYNSRLAYLCDVKRSQIDNALKNLKNKINYVPNQTDDINEVLSDKDVDAIFIATPDHWHAPATVMALDAGKHVYVEKPCAHNPMEAEIMVSRQKQSGKIVQMGNQQRSSDHTIEIINDIHKGVIGKPYKALAFYSNRRGEVPKQVKQKPPSDLNWDLFQGPAPRQEYTHNTWDYNWHWYGWKWGTAETGNNAIHELDIGRWALQVDYPEHVLVDAAKLHFVDDGWEMYDTMYATFKFTDNKEIHWDGKSRNGYKTYGAGRGTIVYGTEGSVFVNRESYRLYDRNGELEKESAKTDESGTALGGGGDTSTKHISNFFEAIRGKEKLSAPIQDGAISNHMALLANISYRTGKPFDVNVQNGKAYDREAMALWGREYEPGWEMVV